MRLIGDEVCRQGQVDTNSVESNLLCAVYDWEKSIEDDVKDAFKKRYIYFQ